MSGARKKACNVRTVNAHFDRVEAHFAERVAAGFTGPTPYHPSLIFKCDETGLDPDGSKQQKVVAKTGEECQASSHNSSERAEHSTLMACISAAGATLPPLIILKGVRKKSQYLAKAPRDACLVMTKKVRFSRLR